MSGCRKCREAAFSTGLGSCIWELLGGGFGVAIFSCSSLICCYISNLCDIGAA